MDGGTTARRDRSLNWGKTAMQTPTTAAPSVHPRPPVAYDPDILDGRPSGAATRAPVFLFRNTRPEPHAVRRVNPLHPHPPRPTPPAKTRIIWEEQRVAVQPEHLLSRWLDVMLAAMLVVFLAPVLLIVAGLVWITDPGPIVFAHRRIGRDGRSFDCLKFRSMCIDAEERLRQLLDSDADLRAAWERDHKLPRDPRVTRIGAFLRVTSLDELPQLFNVLRGDMSLVGPRPIVEAEVRRYGRYIRHYCSVKPGLTGVWQISGRSSTTYRRRVAADVLYARLRSIGLDMRILAATVPAVVTGRGSC